MLRLMRFKYIILTFAVIGVIAIPLMALATGPAPQKKDAVDTPSAAAEINGKSIPYAEFEQRLQMFVMRVSKGRPESLPEEMKKKLKTDVIDSMISDELLFEQAVKKGIKVEAGTIDGELKQIKSRFKDEKQYQKQLKDAGLTEDNLKGQIEQRMSISKLIEKEVVPTVKVSDEDAKKYYDANTSKFSEPEQVRARHILMKVNKEDTEEKKKAARKKLKDIQKRILAGEDFSKLAKENSEGPSNVKGGDLGYFSKGRMVKSFEEAAFKLAPNEVSDIVETQFGYHLIKVVDHKAAGTQPFDKIKPRIKSILLNEKVKQKVQPYIKSLRDKAKVKIFVK